jgi:membrane protein DedA with SNARE-associated domain
MIEYIASNLDWIASIAPTWGLLLVFVFMAVESSFIPFPSEVVMIPAGFLAARGELGFSPVNALVLSVLIGTLGSLAGAYVNYFIALKVGKPFLLKYGKWFFLKPAALERSCELFNEYGAPTTFVCRLVPAIRQLISVPAGISRMPLFSFSLFTSLGAFVWTTILSVIGFAAARASGNLTYLELCIKGKEAASSHLPLIISLSVLLAVAYVFISKLVMKGRDRS